MNIVCDHHNLILHYRRAITRTPSLLDISGAPTGLRHAAVLVPVIERHGELYVLFIERATHLRHHAGQIGFPGGAIEKNDASPLACALREAEEEIGLRPNKVQILGPLPPRITAISSFYIQPFLGVVHDFYAERLDRNEVSAVFEAPLRWLLDPKHHEQQSVQWQGATRQFYQIMYDNKRIWGATAGMLVTLAHLLMPEHFEHAPIVD